MSPTQAAKDYARDKPFTLLFNVLLGLSCAVTSGLASWALLRVHNLSVENAVIRQQHSSDRLRVARMELWKDQHSELGGHAVMEERMKNVQAQLEEIERLLRAQQ